MLPPVTSSFAPAPSAQAPEPPAPLVRMVEFCTAMAPPLTGRKPTLCGPLVVTEELATVAVEPAPCAMTPWLYPLVVVVVRVLSLTWTAAPPTAMAAAFCGLTSSLLPLPEVLTVEPPNRTSLAPAPAPSARAPLARLP